MSNKIKEKLIYFQSKDTFQTYLDGGKISDTSIVFIGEHTEAGRETLIYTHGNYYGHTSQDIRDIIEATICDSSNLRLGEDYYDLDGINIEYPEILDENGNSIWQNINPDNPLNGKIDTVQSAIAKLDKNIATLAKEVITDEKILSEALSDLDSRICNSHIFYWGEIGRDSITEDEYNKIREAEQVLIKFESSEDNSSFQVVNDKVNTDEGINLIIFTFEYIDRYIISIPNENGDCSVSREKTSIDLGSSLTSESLRFGGIVDITKDLNENETDKNVASIAKNLVDGQVALCIIGDKNGNYPETSATTVIANSALTSGINYFFSDSPVAANVGDILLIYKIKYGIDIISFEFTALKIIPLYDAKPSSTNFPGTNGIMTVGDKELINSLNTRVGSAEWSINNVRDIANSALWNSHVGWLYDINIESDERSFLEIKSGVYPTWRAKSYKIVKNGVTISNSPFESATEGDYFTCIVHRTTSADGSGYDTVEQTAYGRCGDDFGKIYKRTIFLYVLDDYNSEISNKRHDWGAGWKRIDINSDDITINLDSNLSVKSHEKVSDSQVYQRYFTFEYNNDIGKNVGNILIYTIDDLIGNNSGVTILDFSCILKQNVKFNDNDEEKLISFDYRDQYLFGNNTNILNYYYDHSEQKLYVEFISEAETTLTGIIKYFVTP